MTLLWSVLARLGHTILDDNLHSICVFYLIFANPQKKKKKKKKKKIFASFFGPLLEDIVLRININWGRASPGLDLYLSQAKVKT